MRLCKQCEKETDRYAKGQCRPCALTRMRQWRAANREKMSAYHATNGEKIRASGRERSRKHRTGFTAELFAARILVQGNRCAICEKSLEGYRGGGDADHCHATGKPRAILCNRCNVWMAAIDSPLLVKLLAYASHWRRVHEEGLE
jgi:hypothetical protein